MLKIKKVYSVNEVDNPSFRKNMLSSSTDKSSIIIDRSVTNNRSFDEDHFSNNMLSTNTNILIQSNKMRCKYSFEDNPDDNCDVNNMYGDGNKIKSNDKDNDNDNDYLYRIDAVT